MTTLSPGRQSIALATMFSPSLVLKRKAISSSSAPKREAKRRRARSTARLRLPGSLYVIFSSAYETSASRTARGSGPVEAVFR